MMSSSKSVSSSGSEDDNEIRRGPWTLEEDNLLTQSIANQGEGRWNLLAKCSGLKRTGKSCRLRWLNYLKPDVKRGNLTPQEQLLILELHSKWGNRWSKIAQHLPGRTDNEIKNYWRTKIQKQARHLKIDTDSREFEELVRRFWIPRLLQKARESSSSSALPIQNQATMPVSQYSAAAITPPPCVHPTCPNYLDQRLEQHSNGSCVSFSEPKLPQLLGYNSNHFGNGLDTDEFGTFTYDYGYHVNSNGYDNETLNMEYPVDDCQMARHNWVNDFACDLWNMDECCQFSNFKK
ncbi:hypothetical protein HN51_035889 [Arachis hypogaea]|nr:transcription factor MYB62 [Arachis ipaensis]XP_016193394.1 transcription factor MYB62 [Arachis ipaensis]XP_025644266.1 transcription factor MYB62 [Arachis hypogaea]QHO01122.1 Transcription factor [Arachis hypogaea]RYR20656.1 hypothetical protein Ahy_B03g065854 isoform B [Arachis hypogaea]